MQKARSGRVQLLLLLLACFLASQAVRAEVLLSDDFNTGPMDSSLWHIPTWVSSTDGTFIGRTQMRVSQNSDLPAIVDGNAIITVETYNPTGFSFYGTDLRSNDTFSVSPELGIDVRIRAKLDTLTPGTVGGIFLYALINAQTTAHDEIDFELLGNYLNDVQTNVYANEPLGAGHPIFIPFASGTSTSYHTYRMVWFPTRVSWYIDDVLVRMETTHVPQGPMRLHLNMWVPDAGWAAAYSPALQPTSSASQNEVYSMSVDWVTVESIPPGC